MPLLTQPFDPDPKIAIVDSSADLTAPITFVVPDEYAWRRRPGPRIDSTELRGDTLELVLSGCGTDEQIDLRPALPLVIDRHP